MTEQKPPLTGLKGGKHLSWAKRILFWIQRIPRRLTRIPDSPHEIAKAFAVGVFIGILPGMGTFVAILAAFVFRLSKGAAILGSLMSNPWTVAPIYAASYRMGKWILRHDISVEWSTLYKFNAGWTHELGKIFPSVVTGGVILALALAFLSYGISLFVITRYRNSRLKKLHAR